MYSPEEARDMSQRMLGHRLVTKQTGSGGRPCNLVQTMSPMLS